MRFTIDVATAAAAPVYRDVEAVFAPGGTTVVTGWQTPVPGQIVVTIVEPSPSDSPPDTGVPGPGIPVAVGAGAPLSALPSPVDSHGTVMVTVGFISQTVQTVTVVVKPGGIYVVWPMPGFQDGVAPVQDSVIVYVADAIPVEHIVSQTVVYTVV